MDGRAVVPLLHQPNSQSMKNSSQTRLGKAGGIAAIHPQPIALGAGEGLGDQFHA